jgi:hypothetical protein
MNRRLSKLGIVVTGLLAMSVVAGVVTATSPTPAGGATWSPNQYVPYRWKEGIEPPAWARGAINAAAADSNASRASRAGVLGQQGGATSWIGYTADIPTGYAIAYTTASQPDWFHIRLRPQGYVLDWGKLRWCQYYADPPDGCYDAEMITLHELGHVQSLDHPNEADVTNWLDTVMHEYPKTKAKAGWNAHAYGRCDVAKLQIRYKALTSRTLYSTCLSLASQLSLSASATSVESGSNVSFTARLKVACDSPHASLACEPASGRNVKLQRRSTSGGSWTTVADMGPTGDDSGSYVATIQVKSTYDWRALFPAPAEGLLSSASGQVRVTAYGPCRYATRISPTYVVC